MLVLYALTCETMWKLHLFILFDLFYCMNREFKTLIIKSASCECMLSSPITLGKI